MLSRYILVAGLVWLALASPACAQATQKGINSSPNSDLPIGAGGNGPFINISPLGQIDFFHPANAPSLRLGAAGDILFLTAANKPALGIAADGGITFYLSPDAAGAPIKFKHAVSGRTLGDVIVTDTDDKDPTSSAIFTFPSFESTNTNNGYAGIFKGSSGGITVSPKSGFGGQFRGAPAIEARAVGYLAELAAPASYAGFFGGVNGIMAVANHNNDHLNVSPGLAGNFQGRVFVSDDLSVGSVYAGRPVGGNIKVGGNTNGVLWGVVTVGTASIDANTVFTANALRDLKDPLDASKECAATGKVLTKNGPNSFTCVTVAAGAGAPGPMGPQGPAGPGGTIGDVSCSEGQVLTGFSGGQPVCGGVVLASYYQGIPEGWHSEIINLPQNGVLNAHCFAAADINIEGSCPGDQYNAGAQAIIDVDGVVCSHDVSFDFPSCRVTFRATASCSRPLAAGKHTISCYVGRYGNDTNVETFRNSSFGFNVITM